MKNRPKVGGMVPERPMSDAAMRITLRHERGEWLELLNQIRCGGK